MYSGKMVNQKPTVITSPRRRKRLKNDDVLRLAFNHGLGDALMFRVALSHVKKPVLLHVHTGCRYAEVFEDLPHVTVSETRRAHRNHYDIRFYPENDDKPCQAGPKTKTRICLEHELSIVAESIVVRPMELKWGRRYTPEVWVSMMNVMEGGSRPYVVMHGQAASSPQRKSCPLWMAYQIQQIVEDMGYRLIVLNYDFNHRFGAVPDYWWVGLNDSRSTKGWPLGPVPMWHILNQASGFIGIDSGPLHLALTIPGLPCVFIRNQIDFMTSFYDAGLQQIKDVISWDTHHKDVESVIRNLPRKTQGGVSG